MSATLKSVHQKYVKAFAGLKYYEDRDEIKKKLRQDGFKKIKGFDAFYKDNCIVKFSFLLGNKRAAKAIKTYITLFHSSIYLVVQPRCDNSKTSQSKAYSSLQLENDWLDSAPRNCGIYKGKAVIFDW